MSLKKYRSPNGDLIIGAAEQVLVTAYVDGIDPETQAPEYSSTGSEVHRDTQEVVTREGKALWVCESGHEWTFDQLVEAGHVDD
jgi:hypothetical protein